jgi:predicted unusual protein kinase regulating ubiquinone biosynthesis (AarF/ABC1/UbiB family)
MENFFDKYVTVRSHFMGKKQGGSSRSSQQRGDGNHIDRRRYRKVRNFFLRVFLHVIWWDLLLNRPFLRLFRKPQPPRWKPLAREFRQLALEMGGVLIKLGQFLSVRVDILPPEVTTELAGLQDEVPAEPIEPIVAQIEADFGRPLSELFKDFSPKPQGSASLAQAHAAHLVAGESVVVKVLRPGIDLLVESDLAAISEAIRWLKFYKPIRSRVDLDRFAEEFSRVTREELDLLAEGEKAERFAQDFRENEALYVPQVYWDYSSTRTLTLENVGFVKIDDLKSLKANGIDPAQIARTLYQVYMEQIFVTNFVHVDPHSGNFFVRVLPGSGKDAGEAMGQSEGKKSSRPFQIVFVDFGMMSVIPDELRGALREYAIGIGTRNAKRIVNAYQAAGILLPHGDRERLEEATADMLQRFAGIRMGDVRELALSEARYFMSEYRDLIYDAPMQFPVELLFVFRAVGMLAGLTTSLDPNFSPLAETIPFATRLAQGRIGSVEEGFLEKITDGAIQVLAIPFRVEQLLSQCEEGTLTVTSNLAPASLRAMRRLERSQRRVSASVTVAGFLVAGSVLLSSGVYMKLGLSLVATAAILGLGALVRTHS